VVVPPLSTKHSKARKLRLWTGARSPTRHEHYQAIDPARTPGGDINRETKSDTRDRARARMSFFVALAAAVLALAADIAALYPDLRLASVS
jgi:hypothetical protein